MTYADPTKRAPKPLDDVIPRGATVIVSYNHTGLTQHERTETNHLLDLIAFEHLRTNFPGLRATFDTETVLSYSGLDSTVGIAPFERALAAVKGVGPVGFLFGVPRIAQDDSAVAVVA